MEIFKVLFLRFIDVPLDSYFNSLLLIAFSINIFQDKEIF